MAEHEWDVVVIGAGPVGENVADRVVQGGLSAALVESDLVGGECSYWACMPSKALLRTGAAARAASAVRVPGVRIDPAAVLRRRDEFASQWDDSGQVSWVRSAGIELVRGHGVLDGDRRVRVTTAEGEAKVLQARHAVVLATGSAPLLPPIPGLAEVAPWTSREATSAGEVPASVAIIGGGVVATEAATFLADLGATVTLLARSSVLGAFEPFAGDLVVAGLRERGVEVLEDAAVARVESVPDGARLVLESGQDIVVERVVVAAGRVPRIGDAGVESVGLDPHTEPLVEETMRVRGREWLYAVGDVNARAMLTHQGKYQARAAGDAIVARATGRGVEDSPWGTHVATADHAAVPQVVFTDPEVAAVGMTAAQAEASGIRSRVVDYDLGSVAGAALMADGFTGQARMVVDEDRGVLVGMTLVGPGVGELIHAATIAIVGEVPIQRLWHAVPAYPTVSEIWLRLLEAYGR